MKNKIQAAIKDMYEKVVFEEDGHTYKRVDDGAYLQGVSTVSSIIPKDWLAAWGGKECAKFLGYSDYDEDTGLAAEMLEKIKQLDLKGFIALLKEAKGAAFRKSKEAMIDGKTGHKWLEDYVLAKIRGDEPPTVPDGTLGRPIQQFLEWEKQNVKEWVASEARVAYPEKGYAGTLDAIAIMQDDKLAIIDFKFASNVSEDYYLQLAGYAATFEPYDIKFDQRIILRLPKTLERDEWDPKTRTYTKVENTIEAHEVQTDYERDRDVFFHALPVKQWINYVQNHGTKTGNN